MEGGRRRGTKIPVPRPIMRRQQPALAAESDRGGPNCQGQSGDCVLLICHLKPEQQNADGGPELLFEGRRLPEPIA